MQRSLTIRLLIHLSLPSKSSKVEKLQKYFLVLLIKRQSSSLWLTWIPAKIYHLKREQVLRKQYHTLITHYIWNKRKGIFINLHNSIIAFIPLNHTFTLICPVPCVNESHVRFCKTIWTIEAMHFLWFHKVSDSIIILIWS